MNKFLLRLLLCAIFLVGYMAFTGNWGILDTYWWIITHPTQALSDGWQIIKGLIVVFVILPLVLGFYSGDSVRDQLDRIESLLRRR